MIWDRVKDILGRRRRGAVAVLAVATIVPVTTMLAAHMNAGQMIEDRRQVQDAADALAEMHGAWTARSLNTLSMNNVTTTQAVTLALGSEALNGTLWEMVGTAAAIQAYVMIYHLPVQCIIPSIDPASIAWNIGCGYTHGTAIIPATQAQIDAAGIWSDFDPRHGMDTAEKAMEAIEGMNQAIIQRFPRAIAEMGSEYAAAHGVDDFYFDDPCQGPGPGTCATSASSDGMALPIEPIPVSPLDASGSVNLSRAEFCAAMQFGTPALGLKLATFDDRAFPQGSGPLTYSGPSGNKTVRNYINEITEVHDPLSTMKRAYQRRGIPIYVPPIPGLADGIGENVGGSDLPTRAGILTPHPQALNLIGPQTRTNNALTRRFDAKFGLFCLGISTDDIPILSDIIDVLGNILPGITFELETPVPTLWKLRDVSPLSILVTPEQMPDDFRILAVTAMTKSSRVASSVLTDGVQYHHGYGQVGVYNPISADLFSQDWTYRPMPATRMDDPGAVAQGLRADASAMFAPLADSLSAAAGSAEWGRINAH
ncbi:MAG: hypothetical protein AAFV31_04740 [Pseudomonadota bacterium]